MVVVVVVKQAGAGIDVEMVRAAKNARTAETNAIVADLCKEGMTVQEARATIRMLGGKAGDKSTAGAAASG